MIDPKSKRGICEAIRELYRRILTKDNIADEEELIKYIYVSAKKMNKKLLEYNGTNVQETEKHWLYQLSEIKRTV